MKQIWKYQFDPVSNLEVQIPEGGQILSVQTQMGVGTMWVLIDPTVGLETRRFRVFGTGHTIPDGFEGTYVGTWQLGALVWHLFEVK